MPIVLDPPITAKERALLRQYRAIVMAAVSFLQFAKDPGVRSIALEEVAIFDENSNRRVQAYRDGKDGSIFTHAEQALTS